VASAQREGFPVGTIIFLDIEEGGRMLPEQKSYIYAWVDAVTGAGFRAGVYCSGIPAREDKNTTIVTADDIRDNAQGRQIVYWVTNDVCPPSSGCAFPVQPPRPADSKIDFADVWQFAQSPRRTDFAAKCHNYNRDGNCYPPGVSPSSHLFVDVNTATSADPSAPECADTRARARAPHTCKLAPCTANSAQCSWILRKTGTRKSDTFWSRRASKYQ
jgi:hypothetical protein